MTDRLCRTREKPRTEEPDAFVVLATVLFEPTTLMLLPLPATFGPLIVLLSPNTKLFESVDFAGPLPSAIQNYTQFAPGIVTGSGETEAARALITFLSSPAAATVLKAKGFE